MSISSLGQVKVAEGLVHRVLRGGIWHRLGFGTRVCLRASVCGWGADPLSVTKKV